MAKASAKKRAARIKKIQQKGGTVPSGLAGGGAKAAKFKATPTGKIRINKITESGLAARNKLRRATGRDSTSTSRDPHKRKSG